jgi:hypothetical protein
VRVSEQRHVKLVTETYSITVSDSEQHSLVKSQFLTSYMLVDQLLKIRLPPSFLDPEVHNIVQKSFTGSYFE